MPRSVTLFLLVSVLATVGLAFFTEAHAENNVVVTAGHTISGDTMFTAKKCLSRRCRTATMLSVPATRWALGNENAKRTARQLASVIKETSAKERIEWLFANATNRASRAPGVPNCTQADAEMLKLRSEIPTGVIIDLKGTTNCPFPSFAVKVTILAQN